MSHPLRISWLVCAALSTAQAVADVEVAPEVSDALTAGRARVIVELALARDFVPEGQLSPALAEAQRAAIAAAQDAVLAAIADRDARLLRRPTTVPFLALDIGPDALTTLEGMSPRISRILLDGTATASPRKPLQGAHP